MASYGREVPVIDTYHAVVLAYSDFLTVAIHTILYERNIYPPQSFIKARKYNYPVRQSRHPQVCTWIKDAVAAVEVEMLKVGWVFECTLILGKCLSNQCYWFNCFWILRLTSRLLGMLGYMNGSYSLIQPYFDPMTQVFPHFPVLFFLVLYMKIRDSGICQYRAGNPLHRPATNNLCVSFWRKCYIPLILNKVRSLAISESPKLQSRNWPFATTSANW